MKLLALDTTASAASVCVWENGFLLGEDFINCGFTHSQTVMPMAEHCLRVLNLTVAEMDAFAVSAGPGSFTGVRIGISTIKGLALPTGKPCIGVSTLEALAMNLAGQSGLFCPVMDARRNQVYQALFSWEGGALHRLKEDCAIAIADLGEELKSYKEDIIFVGDGADLCYNMLDDGFGHFKVASAMLKYQRAAGVAAVAQGLYERGSLQTAETLAPIYLRLPQAERELSLKKKSTDNG